MPSNTSCFICVTNHQLSTLFFLEKTLKVLHFTQNHTLIYRKYGICTVSEYNRVNYTVSICLHNIVQFRIYLKDSV